MLRQEVNQRATNIERIRQ